MSPTPMLKKLALPLVLFLLALPSLGMADGTEDGGGQDPPQGKGGPVTLPVIGPVSIGEATALLVRVLVL